MPYKNRLKLKQELKWLEEQKIISRGDSIYASPCFTATKPNGDIRKLIDYRKLNEKTEDINFNFPRVYDEFFNFRAAK